MLTPALALAALLAAAPAAAPPRKPPMIHVTLEASVTFGPGREPLPGTPPFQPRLEAALAFRDPLPKGTSFRLWLLPAPTPASTPAAAAKGRLALPIETASREDRNAVLRADWPQGRAAEDWQVAVDCLAGGRVRGSTRAAVKARYLPAPPPRGREGSAN